MKKVHLICNAHIDPVWLWQWYEGAAEAISTFRIAADFCENYEGFIFNHNEVILYRWIEEYEPELFKRIQKLVKQRKWHIMGGWYLQPDCNMPCGESFVRQILLGREYFQNKFGVTPSTAINFDSFGHSRGLVQILAKSGYDSYLFGRPDQQWCGLDCCNFIWKGYDGSEIMATRFDNYYCSPRGKAREKVEKYLGSFTLRSPGVVLWGVGNHGGGPSKIDLEDLNSLIKENCEFEITHSTPEAYFQELKINKSQLPLWSKDLNPFAVGCYTSMANIKKKHRMLESELFLAEKMISAAHYQGLSDYPTNDINEIMCDLATCQFHDALPGTSIQKVEEAILRQMDHGLEIADRLKARAFFALVSGQEKAAEGHIPVFVYNPHPFKITTQVECEFQLADQNRSSTFMNATAYRDGLALPSQIEKEDSNHPLDWRKKIVFEAELEPSQINRFDCTIEELPSKPHSEIQPKEGKYVFDNGLMKVVINTDTGLIDSYMIKSTEYLSLNAFEPILMEDDADAWVFRKDRFEKKIGSFKLLSSERAAKLSCLKSLGIPSVRVVECGPVRTIIESVLGYENSYIIQRYILPQNSTEFGVETRVFWFEKDCMLKMQIPFCDKNARFLTQVAYGMQENDPNGKEVVTQKYGILVSEDKNIALSIINNRIYGCDYSEKGLRMSLLRAPAYSGHAAEYGLLLETVTFGPPVLPSDYYTPRMDQGESVFKFWINGSSIADRLSHLTSEATAKHESPFALSFFPSGNPRSLKQFILLSNSAIELVAAKKAQANDNLIIRLFEPTGQKATAAVRLPFAGMEFCVKFEPFEIKTFSVDIKNKVVSETDLMERIISCKVDTKEQ